MAKLKGRGVSIDEAVRIALALPEAASRPTHRHLGLIVRKKGFAYLYEDEAILLVRATREEQAALAAEDPLAYKRSHTSGRFGWVAVRLAQVRRDELAELITEAWRLTAPKSLAAGYDGAG
ncbi:MAG: hypothetical protein AUI14_09290 [Actinobacteria bacterium 13_2_20CM_2_71_6]|nr:MAG: hypothetical protein AUI14_09290 [Actinobacteria bacterium 13_2_20CM_2_71_6]